MVCWLFLGLTDGCCCTVLGLFVSSVGLGLVASCYVVLLLDGFVGGIASITVLAGC